MSLPENHLAQEAIAALVDGELPAGPAGRAARHLTGCATCRMAVAAQREAKEALHASADVDVPGDLLSRLQAIPFTTEVPGGSGGGLLAAGPDRLVVQDGAGSWAGSWAVPLTPQSPPDRPDHARWLRRGVAGGIAALGLGVTALALSLPPGDPAPAPAQLGGPAATEHTRVVPPVVRTVTLDTAPRDPAAQGNAAPVRRAGGTP
jgi:Putative zinc-finger